MKILRAVSRGKPPAMYDEKILARLDEEQGRRRLNNAEVDMLIALKVGTNLIMQAYEDVLQPFARYAGADRRLKQAITLLCHANQMLADKIAGAQLITIANNTDNNSISLSSMPTQKPGNVNIDWAALCHITNRALETCEMTCTCDSLQSRQCALRRAFEQVPSLALAAKVQAKKNKRNCPYMLLEMDPDYMEE